MKYIRQSLVIIFMCCSVLVQSQDFLQEDSVNVYVVNRGWHTGLLFGITTEVITLTPSLTSYVQNKFVEIGWGDEEFYQYPGDFDLWLGAKAILSPTPSVLRIQGFDNEIEEIVSFSEYCIEIKMVRENFVNMCKILENEFTKDENNNPLTTSESRYVNIIFYHSKKYYSLFRTCNTWIAEILEEAGLNVNTFMLITAEQLFNELQDIGRVIIPAN